MILTRVEWSSSDPTRSNTTCSSHGKEEATKQPSSTNPSSFEISVQELLDFSAQDHH